MEIRAEKAGFEEEGELPDAWIIAGRNGSAEARGKLFERCREYLLLVADRELDRDLRGKIGASDLVQQAFLDAERGFDQFRGESEEEVLAWLHRILSNRAGQAVRFYRRAAKRNVRFERSLASCDGEASELQIAGKGETPSRQLAAVEEALALSSALQRLPEPYQRVIQWRNTDRKQFAEIGALLQRSPEAARKLWVRAIEQLRVELENANGAPRTD